MFPDRIYEVSEMLRQARSLRDSSPVDSDEKRYFAREAYRWSKELLDSGINPSSIDSPEFRLEHKFGII